MKRYQIVVKGEVGQLLSNALSDLEIETQEGMTVLTADVADGPALFKILDRLRDFALEVVSFKEVEEATGS